MFPNMHSPNAEYYISCNQLFKGIWGSYLKDNMSSTIRDKTLIFYPPV